MKSEFTSSYIQYVPTFNIIKHSNLLKNYIHEINNISWYEKCIENHYQNLNLTVFCQSTVIMDKYINNLIISNETTEPG